MFFSVQDYAELIYANTMFFLALYGRHKKQLSIDEITRIMAVYERRAPQIEDALRYL